MSWRSPGCADVALILEGTYPYVAGGVSSWVHQILCAHPRRRFALLHIGPQPDSYRDPLYQLPANVTALVEVHCRGGDRPAAPAAPRSRVTGRPSRVLAALRRLHLDDQVDDALLGDLAAGDLSIAEFLHGPAAFALLRDELYQRLSPDAPFMDFFWHVRAMHIPLLRLLAAPCPPAAVYHAVSTGYAGLVGAIASLRTGAPLVVTEHGLYARERELELSRARWIRDVLGSGVAVARPSPLRRIWSHYFRMLSRIAYHRASHLLTLSEANRAKQLADGADPRKTMVVPNGVDQDRFRVEPVPGQRDGAAERLRVGFVGRVVPVKDVLTLIRAVDLARAAIDLEVWIIGPEDEDPGYAQRCHALVRRLGLSDRMRFLGPQKVATMYPQLDLLALTSLSEGQPLVMLEAYAAGLPVVATDVGACRELIEGGDERDRALGASGIVTRVASPAETAAAFIRLARDPELRLAMGRAGRARVEARYQLHQVIERYDSLYASMVSP
jgi:glycosyltransferase involved in cell wall biosynthesis